MFNTLITVWECLYDGVTPRQIYGLASAIELLSSNNEHVLTFDSQEHYKIAPASGEYSDIYPRYWSHNFQIQYLC